MPGAYTHFTMAHIASARPSLEKIPDFPKSAIAALGKWLQFCELGVVSPDYPYLDTLRDSSKRWADLMHLESTGGVIRESVVQLLGMAGPAQEKGLAWLLGYTAHVIMDVTIHPVINCMVGPYASNKLKHRVCEMNQDVYIFQRLKLTVDAAEFLDDGIGQCVGADGNLDEDVVSLWRTALSRVYPNEFAVNEPRPDRWHGWFRNVVDKVAEEGGWLSAMSRHVMRGDTGIGYPRTAAIERRFIENLPTPDGGKIQFDDLFDRAKDNVQHAWKAVARAALNLEPLPPTMLRDWNLDEGTDPEQNSVFWSAKP